MQTVLVTGGAGFIGSNIVFELLKRGYKVKVIDNLITGRRENLAPVIGKIKFIEGSITDLELLKKEFKDVDFVLHQAALPSIPRSIDNPIKTNDMNTNGTLNVLVAARDSSVKRVVYASSSSIYGDSEKLPKVETMTPNPLSPYAVTKLVGEHYMKVFYKIYGLETVTLRYFNVFGPNQDPSSQYAAAIPLFIKAMMNNKQPTIFGDGKQSRDFTYVQNVVEANILACTAKKAPGEVINIACGERITMLKLVQELNKILGKNIKPVFADIRKGDVKHSQADVTKAKKLLGFKVLVSFEEGLKKTVEWFKKTKS